LIGFERERQRGGVFSVGEQPLERQRASSSGFLVSFLERVWIYLKEAWGERESQNTVRRVFIKWGVDTAVAHMPCASLPTLSLSLSLEPHFLNLVLCL